LSDSEIDTIKEDLIHGSILAERAGFDGVDIKCCHRYLNSELLSAFTREGKYGGTIENRTRLLREVIDGSIASCSSEFIISSRLNVYDGFEYPYGFGVKEGSLEFDPTEPIWLLNELKKSGIKLLNITMGNPYVNPHVNRPFASGGYTAPEKPIEGVARMLNGIATLKKAVPEIKLISSGISYLGTLSPNVCASYIENDGFDFCGYGRMIFAYPDFANDILKNGALDEKKICICCSKCTEIMRSGSTPGCVIRDKEIYAELYKKHCIKKG
jgi:2,4-dienoyl-CoA reductase-like NADH-dependent reductase (Old Yellow Enzyme family)